MPLPPVEPEEALRLVSVYRRVLDDFTKDPPNSLRRAKTYHWGSVLLQALNRNKDAATERDEGVKILTEALGTDYPLNVYVPRFLDHLKPDGS